MNRLYFYLVLIASILLPFWFVFMTGVPDTSFSYIENLGIEHGSEPYVSIVDTAQTNSFLYALPPTLLLIASLTGWGLSNKRVSDIVRSNAKESQ